MSSFDCIYICLDMETKNMKNEFGTSPTEGKCVNKSPFWKMDQTKINNFNNYATYKHCNIIQLNWNLLLPNGTKLSNPGRLSMGIYVAISTEVCISPPACANKNLLCIHTVNTYSKSLSATTSDDPLLFNKSLSGCAFSWQGSFKRGSEMQYKGMKWCSCLCRG